MRPDATQAFPSAMESTIVVASNRGPVSFDPDASGALTSQRGAGGLVTALSGVFFRDDTTWVSAAMTDGDRAVALEGYEIDPDSHQREGAQRDRGHDDRDSRGALAVRNHGFPVHG